jgi:hypothetical protein
MSNKDIKPIDLDVFCSLTNRSRPLRPAAELIGDDTPWKQTLGKRLPHADQDYVAITLIRREGCVRLMAGK